MYRRQARLLRAIRFCSVLCWCEESVGARGRPGPSSFGKKDAHYAPETRFSQDNCRKAGQQQNQEQYNNHVLNEAFGVPSANRVERDAFSIMPTSEQQPSPLHIPSPCVADIRQFPRVLFPLRHRVLCTRAGGSRVEINSCLFLCCRAIFPLCVCRGQRRSSQ